MLAEGRHTSEAHTVFNNPEDFTVGKILSFGPTQIWRLGIKAATDHRIAATIIAVANSAMVGEVQTRLTKNFGRQTKGIFGGTRVVRPGKATHITGQRGFESGWSGAGIEAIVEDRGSGSSEQASGGDENQQEESAALHMIGSHRHSIR